MCIEKKSVHFVYTDKIIILLFLNLYAIIQTSCHIYLSFFWMAYECNVDQNKSYFDGTHFIMEVQHQTTVDLPEDMFPWWRHRYHYQRNKMTYRSRYNYNHRYPNHNLKRNSTLYTYRAMFNFMKEFHWKTKTDVTKLLICIGPSWTEN